MRVATFLLVLACFGCSEQIDAISVSGRLLLDGIPTEGEILIEPVAQKNASSPPPVTVFANSDGQFSATIAYATEENGSLPCRLVLRVSPPSTGDVPAALDETAPPEKIVTLHRRLHHGDVLTLLVTH
jgi:hypothetical protein